MCDLDKDGGFMIFMSVVAFLLFAMFIWVHIYDKKPGPLEQLDIDFQKRRDRERQARRRGDQ